MALAAALLLLCAALPAGALARPSTPAEVQAANDLDAYFSTLPGLGESGTFLVAVGHHVILHRSYGWADGAHTDPLKRSDIGVAASITKVFTATAIMQLQEQGKLNVDNPITDYLPNVPADKQAITIREMLSHTSGLSPNGELGDQFTELTRKHAIELALSGDLLFPPGTDFSYSNAGFILSAAIIEKLSGVPYEKYIHKYVMKPLHLKRTGFYGDPLDRAQDYARVAVAPQVINPDIAPFGSPDDTNPLYWPLTWSLKGAGGVVSTPADLFDFFEQVCRPGRVLTPASVHEMLQRDPVSGYGLGLQWLGSDYGPIVFHSGGNDFGNKSIMLRYVDHDVTFVAQTNTFDDDNSPGYGSLIFDTVPGIMDAHGLMSGGGAAGRCIT